MSQCHSCGAPISWVETTEGHKMPLDPDPVPDGNIVLEYERGEVIPAGAIAAERRLVARVLTKAALARLSGAALPGLEAKLYKSHYATCPDANRWRKKRPAGR